MAERLLRFVVALHERGRTSELERAIGLVLDPGAKGGIPPNAPELPGKSVGEPGLICQLNNFCNAEEEIGYYTLLSALGRGQFGIVRKAFHRTTGVFVAVKRITKEKMQECNLVIGLTISFSFALTVWFSAALERQGSANDEASSTSQHCAALRLHHHRGSHVNRDGVGAWRRGFEKLFHSFFSF